jgi:hypothetical protein
MAVSPAPVIFRITAWDGPTLKSRGLKSRVSER